jgi:hypothetical protein
MGAVGLDRRAAAEANCASADDRATGVRRQAARAGERDVRLLATDRR